MVEIGDHAPVVKVRMTYQGEVNTEYNLADAYAKGKTLLYFFPAAFTGVCTASSCLLRDNLSFFEDLRVNIFGISTDMPFTHNVFAERNQINYPLLSDWNKELIEAFGVRDDNFGPFQGVARRSLFLVDNGKIVFRWLAEHPGKYPPFEEVKQILTS